MCLQKSLMSFENMIPQNSCGDSSTHSSGPEDSGCGTSSCDEIDVESIDTSSNGNLKSSSFSISNLLKEKSDSSFKSNPHLTLPSYTHLYHYNNLLHPLNLFQGTTPKMISSINNYQKQQQHIKQPKTEFRSFDLNQSLPDSGSDSGTFLDEQCGSPLGSEICSKLMEKDENGHHSCDVCGKKFKHVRMLNRHRRNHNPYKKYKCNFCGKGFNDSFDLKRHVRTHTGVKPYNCDSCEKSFTQRCSLESHMDKIHGVKHKFTYKQRREKIYVCEDCGYSTQDVRDHYKHSRDHHQTSFHQNLSLQPTSLSLLENNPFIMKTPAY